MSGSGVGVTTSRMHAPSNAISPSVRKTVAKSTVPRPTRSWAQSVGIGTVDFATVFRTLDEIAFDGGCILEVVTPTPLPDIEASLDALASAGAAKLPLVDTGRTG